MKDVLGRWGKRVGEATKKAEDLAGNTWQHCEFYVHFLDILSFWCLISCINFRYDHQIKDICDQSGFRLIERFSLAKRGLQFRFRADSDRDGCSII